MIGPIAHSELGASISERWMACPGSVNLSRGRENIQTEHAKRGQVAHIVAARALGESLEADWFVGDVIEGITVDEEMAAGVQHYIDHCRALTDICDAYGIEEQFDIGTIVPGGFGTTDFWAYHAAGSWHYENILDIVDYKNGTGVVVEVEGNSQLRYYALGAAIKLGDKYPIDKVRITIVQPNAVHPDGIVRSETLDYLDLLAFAGELRDAALKTQAPDAPLIAGSHCRFCPALAICPAQREQTQALAQVAFEAMPVSLPPEPEAMPDEILDDIGSKLEILDNWSAAVKRELERRILAGRPMQFHKLVEKRANRKWIDPEQVQAELYAWGLHESEYFKEPELKSPAMIEKLLTKDQKRLLADLVVKKSSGYKLVRENHPSPALASAPQEAFAALPPASE